MRDGAEEQEQAQAGVRAGGLARLARSPHVVLCALLIACVLAGAVVQTLYTWQATEAAARRQAQNLAALAARRLGSDLGEVRRVVEVVADDFPLALLRGPVDATARQRIEAQLAQFDQMAPLVNGLRVHTADGRLRFGSRPGDAGGPPLPAAFIEALRDPSQPDVYYSHVQSRPGSASATLYVVHALRDAHQHLLGVVSAGIDIGRWGEDLRQLDLGELGVIALRRLDDGEAVLRLPVTGAVVPAGRLAALTAVRAGASSGLTMQTSPVDGVTRLYAHDRLLLHPFYVVAGLARADYLAAWRWSSAISWAACIALSLVLVAVFRRLARQAARHRADAQRLQASEQRLLDLYTEQKAVTDNDSVAILKLEGGRITWTSRGVDRIFGNGTESLVGQGLASLCSDEQAGAALLAQVRAALAAQGRYRAQHQMRRRDGEPVWLDVSCAALDPQTAYGAGSTSLWVMSDISTLVRQQEQIVALAHADPLTGLPNRRLLMDRLAQGLARARRQQHPLIVAYLDLDRFKDVNDSHGHAAGDTLLVEIGRRLLACVRGHDTVCRVGGDEFVIVLTDLAQTADGLRVLTRVLDEIERPVDLGAGRFGRVSASIGVAVCPDDGDDPDLLLREADRAMYRAKHSGRGTISRVDDLTRPA